MAENTPRGVATPSGRISRTARVAGLGVELAGRALIAGAGALARGEALAPRDLVLTPGISIACPTSWRACAARR